MINDSNRTTQCGRYVIGRYRPDNVQSEFEECRCFISALERSPRLFKPFQVTSLLLYSCSCSINHPNVRERQLQVDETRA